MIRSTIAATVDSISNIAILHAKSKPKPGRGRGSQIRGNLVDVGGYCRKWRGFAGICGGWPAPPPQNRKTARSRATQEGPTPCLPPISTRQMSSRQATAPNTDSSPQLQDHDVKPSGELRESPPTPRSPFACQHQPSSARLTQLTPWNRQSDTIFRHSPPPHKLGAREKCGRR